MGVLHCVLSVWQLSLTVGWCCRSPFSIELARLLTAEETLHRNTGCQLLRGKHEDLKMTRCGIWALVSWVQGCAEYVAGTLVVIWIIVDLMNLMNGVPNFDQFLNHFTPFWMSVESSLSSDVSSTEGHRARRGGVAHFYPSKPIGSESRTTIWIRCDQKTLPLPSIIFKKKHHRNENH